jgi:large subunit ribosomal protein L2
MSGSVCHCCQCAKTSLPPPLVVQDIPVGMPVHNVELVPGKGGQICRSAGCMATIVNKQTEHAIVRLPSGKLSLMVGGR